MIVVVIFRGNKVLQVFVSLMIRIVHQSYPLPPPPKKKKFSSPWGGRVRGFRGTSHQPPS